MLFFLSVSDPVIERYNNYILYWTSSRMHTSQANNNNSLGSYYAFHRASAILSHNKDREFGKAIAEYKDKN
jgi:hypothetical protein